MKAVAEANAAAAALEKQANDKIIAA